MEKETVEIILALKGHSIVDGNGYKDLLASVLSYIYDCPKEYYGDDELWQTLHHVVADAISSCSDAGQIRAFMFNYFDARKRNDELCAFVAALILMQIKSCDKHINGFTKEVVNEVKRKFFEDRFTLAQVSDDSLGSGDVRTIWDEKTNSYYVDGNGEKLIYSTYEEAVRGRKALIEQLLK